MIAAEPTQSNLNVQRRLTELGRIRLGDKGTKGQPQKLTKFRLTSASRPLLEAAARVYGGTVRAWQGAPDDGFWELYTTTDSLDIMVPPVMNAYSQLFEIWDAGGCTLRCDGEWESIAEEACSHGDHEGMQVTTRVSVILPKLPGLGTWRLDTKGWNAAATLPPALDMLLATGQRGWVPAILRLEQQSSKKKIPGANGQLRSQTFRYVVPIIDILGVTFGELLAGAGGAFIAPGAEQEAIPAHTLTPGPHRPPRGTKVDRPQLGPPPALPETSDFRKPESPPAPTASPAPTAASAPPMVSGWAVDEGETPSEAPGADVEATQLPESTPDAAAPAGPAVNDEGEENGATVKGLTREELLAGCEALGVTAVMALAKARDLASDTREGGPHPAFAAWPGNRDLTKFQRGVLLAELEAERNDAKVL